MNDECAHVCVSVCMFAQIRACIRTRVCECYVWMGVCECASAQVLYMDGCV